MFVRRRLKIIFTLLFFFSPIFGSVLNVCRERCIGRLFQIVKTIFDKPLENVFTAFVRPLRTALFLFRSRQLYSYFTCRKEI